MVTTTQTKEIMARTEVLGDRFEIALREFVDAASKSPVENLHDAMAYALGVDVDDEGIRGKRIRPVLCLLTADALGASVDAAIPFALSIELMHNFCLVHDDIEDGDRMRRGRDAVWVRYGLPHAINIGDFLLVQSEKVLADTDAEWSDAIRLRLIRLLSQTLERTHIGQALDMNARAKSDLTVEQYMEIVREKTGHYLAAPIQGGSIVGGADAATIDAIAEMAGFLGPMFQIRDDIIDLTDGKGREIVGSDVCEGKRSYLVAHTASICSDDDRMRLFEVLDRPRPETSPEDIAWVIGLFERHAAIEEGQDRCRQLFAQSQEALAKLPEPLAAVLGPYFQFLAERKR